MTRRRFYLAGFVVALLLAGVASHYASDRPDGLSYVAEGSGIAATEQESPVAGSPLADYQTTGLDGSGLSGGLAGVAGVLTTLAVTVLLVRLVRRRDPRASGGPTGPEPRTSAEAGGG